MDAIIKKFPEWKLFCGIVLVVFLCLFVNVWHTHLWGPDEPREAEIASETLNEGHWVTPRLNRIPFVEKPPLYYDLAATAFALQRRFTTAGTLHPGAARAVSALLGILMLGGVLVLTWKTGSRAAALTAVALCISMPQFYRATHWILVDIGVGAFATGALVACGLAIAIGRRSNWLSLLFYLFAAAAFLTKGMVTLVFLGAAILPWMLIRRRGFPFRLNWTMLVFLLPVALWMILFYREGGIYYFHEHFINNTFGRMLSMDLKLPGSPITISDVEHNNSWFFYLERMPCMFGAAIVFLPLILCAAYREYRLPFFKISCPAPVKRIWDFLTAPPSERTPEDADLQAFLLCWTFVPLIAFSIPAAKEVTYVLPSYAGLAILSARYLDDRRGDFALTPRVFCAAFALPCLLFCVAAEASAISLTLFWVANGVIFALMLGFVLAAWRKRQFMVIRLLVLAALIDGVIIGNTPELMRRMRLHRKCYCDFAPKVWKLTGDRRLVMKGGDESIRGCLPFYGGRMLEMSPPSESMSALLKNDSGDTVIILPMGLYRSQEQNNEFRRLAESWVATHFDLPDKSSSFVVLTPRKAK